ncbi:hypothetical protein [Aquitalea magnusonii]|uniref:hypothetical protein n=1 Tax=Aquitalea magnusonii TaxID=332411 RepID=UPI0011B85236|nr:hypothetical protein [Aquitalea magnusonii]
MINQAAPQHPPPLCFHYHGKPLHVLRHNGQWWLYSDDILAVIGQRLGRRIQQLLTPDTSTDIRPDTESPTACWPVPALLRALRRVGIRSADDGFDAASARRTGKRACLAKPSFTSKATPQAWPAVTLRGLTAARRA